MRTNNIINNIIFLSVIIVVMISCHKKEDLLLPATDGSTVTFYAKSAESHETRTSRQEDGEIWWSPNDRLKVFCGDSYGEFISQNKESSATATFIGEFNHLVSYEDMESKGVVAFYPYSEDVSYDGSGVTFTLPSQQTAVAGTFNEELFPAVAKSNSSELMFYNICGGVKFTVSRSDVRTVTFTSTESKSLAGSVRVCFDENGLPAIDKIISGESSITVSAPDNGTFEIGKEYYIITLPQVLTDGFILTFNKGLNRGNNYYHDESVTINRSKFGKLYNLDKNLMMGDPCDVIVFKDPAVKAYCISKYDTDHDGELSYVEAESVRQLSGYCKDGEEFNEFQYFTGVTELPYVFLNSKIRSITLPNRLKIIRSNAFTGSKLASISIPESVVSIEQNAFSHCDSLKSVVIADNAVLGPAVFIACKNFEELTIGGAVKSPEAFCDLPSLKSVIISDGATCIGNAAFMGCSALENVVISEGVTAIGENAFKGCYSLASIRIPESLVSIGEQAFPGLKTPIKVYITDLSKWCDANGKNFLSTPLSAQRDYGYSDSNEWHSIYLNDVEITDLVIPDDVTSIRAGSFLNCTSIKSVTLHENVVSIGEDAFLGCASLKSVVIPESTTSIGASAFYQCDSLTSVKIPQGITEIEEWSFGGCPLETVVIPDGVTSIKAGAFNKCGSVIFPPSVTSLGSWAFGSFNGIFHISDLTAWCRMELVTAYSSPFSFIYEIVGSDIYEMSGSHAGIPYLNGTELTELIIPDEITSINDFLFFGCPSIKSIVLHDDITYIGELAFAGLWNLETLYIKSLTPPELGDHAIYPVPDIYVPTSSLDEYRKAWSGYYGKIKPYDF